MERVPTNCQPPSAKVNVCVHHERREIRERGEGEKRKKREERRGEERRGEERERERERESIQKKVVCDSISTYIVYSM